VSFKGIQIIDVTKYYSSGQNQLTWALKDINITMKPGEFIGIAGNNASGKTTLARLLNGLLRPSRGRVLIDGLDTCDHRQKLEIRRRVALVFQNPENQFISPVVEEEIAFGPENLNLSLQEISRRVEEALEVMGLKELRLQAPHLLSGGQKQRVAVAAALAMRPDYLVLDEPTSMLDQFCRHELIKHLHVLNRQQGITIILISHYMEDLEKADRLVVLQKGSLIADASPQEIFQREEQLTGLKPPDIFRMAQLLGKMGYNVDCQITTREEMVAYLCRLSKSVI
jgi:energy-coupling factor transport system ATP-binding protein